MKRPKLVAGWRQSWKWFSMQANGLLVAMAAAWVAIPEDVRTGDLVVWAGVAFGVVAALGALGRIIDQGGPSA